MEKKTAKALYDLLKELYQSRAAKEFVDAYEREQHEQCHKRQAVLVNWSIEKDNAYNDLREAICMYAPLPKVQQAAKAFVAICNREEREQMPKAGARYRDCSGSLYTVMKVFLADYGNRTYVNVQEDLRTFPLEEFNSKFTKE